MPPRTSLCTATRLPQAYFSQQTVRGLHNSKPGNASLSASPPAEAPLAPHLQKSTCTNPSLACLPTSQVLRTYLITSISARPALLSACSKIMLGFLNSKSALLDVEKNPILNFALRETFYKQFCGGENKEAVRKNMLVQQKVGYHGVMLEYALEVLKGGNTANEAADIAVWRQGLLDSIDAARSGDYVGLKWSGLGPAALQRMLAKQDPSPAMLDAMHEVCDAAAAKTVRLLPAAEETTTLATFHAWTIRMQRKYNTTPAGSIVFSTYQSYLRQTPTYISEHLADAKAHGYTLGVKLVRGAYLDHEPKELVFPSKEATDEAYDDITAALIHNRYQGLLQPTTTDTAFPPINVVLATHNAVSARKAVALRTAQAERGEKLVPLIYAQLQGMADEVSCELLKAGQGDVAYVPQVFKLSAWGTMKQCLNYLLRRAAENKDAAGRTHESRDAMRGELLRRVKSSVGLA